MSERPEVSLRRFEPGDAAAVHRWFNNPAATRTLMEQRDGFSTAEAEAWVRRAMNDSGEDRKYAILVEGHDEPVGFTALYGLFRQTALGDQCGAYFALNAAYTLDPNGNFLRRELDEARAAVNDPDNPACGR